MKKESNYNDCKRFCLFFLFLLFVFMMDIIFMINARCDYICKIYLIKIYITKYNLVSIIK